ncbi:MAG TPA: hypothetical protein VK982_14995 [Bacteroidales bacterium]|nr:hypothetical protein [Bacteroidales bacterium]
MDNLKGGKRLPDETYEQYKLRRTQEQNQIDEHLKGRCLKKDEIGSQRLRYLHKKRQRGTLQI